MVDLVILQGVSYIAAALGVLIAAIFYVLNLLNNIRTRQAQLFMSLYGQTTNQEFFRRVMEHVMYWEYEDFDDFEAKYGLKTNPVENTYWHLDTNFLEGVGILVNRGLVSVGLVEVWMGFWVLRHWEKFSPYIREFRARYNDPRLFIENERLYNRVKEYRLKHSK